MRHIETSDDRGFDEPRVMRVDAEPDLRAAYHAALTLISLLERECRAADAALEVLGVENDGSSIASRIEKLGEGVIAERAFTNVNAVLRELSEVSLVPTKTLRASDGGIFLAFVVRQRYADVECLNTGEILAGRRMCAPGTTVRPVVWELHAATLAADLAPLICFLAGDPNPEVDPRDAVNERIASLSVAARDEALRRASRSYSAPRSAVRDGARIDGNEVVWPGGERYPMAPRHSSARGED